MLKLWRTICLVCVVCATAATNAPAESIKTLANFDGINGETTSGTFVQGLNGNFYETTSGHHQLGSARTTPPLSHEDFVNAFQTVDNVGA
jgi:hypothetical protein